MKTNQLIYLLVIWVFPIALQSQNIGIGTMAPPQRLSINGKLHIGDDATAPTEGTIRYNTMTRDFEGWTGSEWKSLTFNQSDISTAFTDPNATTFSYIGYATDMSTSLAVAGSLYNNKVEVFSVNNGCWGWQYSISNSGTPGSTVSSQFGAEVKLLGSYQSEVLAVGEPGNANYGNGAGIVGVYRLDDQGATYQYHIAPPDIAAGDAFGRSIGGGSVHMAIGSPYDDDLFTNSGSVYFYRDNVTGAALRQKITSPNAEANGNFGYKVYYNGGYDMFIYARGEGGYTLNGLVYHYLYAPLTQTWSLNQIIGNPEPGNNRYFGSSLDFEGDYMMLSTAQTSTGNYDGTVLFYERNPTTEQWDYTQKLTIPYNSDNDNFGTGIVVDSERMVASAPGYDAKGKNTGALFVFERNGSTWTQTKMLTVADSHPNAYIGRSLSTYSFWYNSLIVGSTSFNNNTGTVHFLKVK